MVRIGTSGWVYKDWRERFYPKGLAQKRWLAYYATRFDTVELNATTYRLPSEPQIATWCAAVPPGFVYTIKLSRLITHRRSMTERVGLFIENYMARAACFDADRVAQILVQFPPYLKRDDAHLRLFLERLPRRWRYVVEFRNPSWFVPEVAAILREFGAAFCIHDYPKMKVPHWVTAPDLAYVRFHGYAGLYVGSYPTRALKRWAETIVRLEAEAREVFVYFNNDWWAAAPGDALRLREMLGR